jgi:hypothetical protein
MEMKMRSTKRQHAFLPSPSSSYSMLQMTPSHKNYMVRSKIEKSANYRSKQIWPENYIDGKNEHSKQDIHILCVSAWLQLPRLICKRLKRRAWMWLWSTHNKIIRIFRTSIHHPAVTRNLIKVALSGLTWHCYRDMIINKFDHSPATHRSHTPSV